MRRFIERLLNRLDRLPREQLETLLHHLATETEQYEEVLNSLTDGVVVCDTDNRLLFANRAAERLLQIIAGDPRDRLVWEALGDRDVADFVRRSLESEDTVLDREWTVDLSGTVRILSVSVLPLVQAGRIGGSIIRVMDITEKRGREARLRRAESLASLTTLAAGVAHEIKNPLGSISIHVQLIERMLRDFRDNTSEVRRYLDVIDEEVQRLNRIVVDFLFSVRPMDTELREGDLNELIRDLITFVSHEVEQAGIELVDRLDPHLPLLRLDDRYLKQALLNIVKNAIAAMPDGGVLTVSTEVRGDDVLLRISDTGVGMSEEVQSKIFDPYFTTRDSGSGIGLTLVYKVIREHLGDITVHSREGRGTTFTITLPVPQHAPRLLGTPGGDEH